MANVLSYPWWSLVLMAVGVIGLITLFLNLFSSVGESPSRATEVDVCELESMDFLLALSGVINAPLHRGGTAKLLNNGDEFHPAMLAAIREARESINFTNYIWQPGKMSDAYFDALTERARAGVQVRVLMDGFGAIRAPRDRVEALRDAGGQWVDYNLPRFGRLTRLHKRTHRRVLVVDGMIGFTGGAAVLDKWLGDAQDPDHWRDSMVEVRGRLALSLQSAFTQLWTETTGELISGPAFYPLDAHEAEQTSEGEPIRRHINVISSPSGQAHPMRHVFWFSIRCARERVYITNPYFVPDRVLAEVLKERARAGVDVRILLPNEHIDLPLIRWASQSYFSELMSAGVRIYEYQPTMIHQKLLVADGVWSLVGSVNLDVRSKELNQENAIGLLDRGFADQVEQTFLEDLSHAREIDPAQWALRPFYRQIVERFFRLFEEQL